ncbi:hypothetical protein EYF80_040476 [Liparis tanakae]|uniref:Uncharacterized protein n=1 Tax=Liparis tanakae TaxID=230148 RepID=A0A4Z2G7W1_9TELE|nr:hypothetical protein EYF80_040476 [Liparis tanakae]
MYRYWRPDETNMHQLDVTSKTVKMSPLHRSPAGHDAFTDSTKLLLRPTRIKGRKDVFIFIFIPLDAMRSRTSRRSLHLRKPNLLLRLSGSISVLQLSKPTASDF